MKTALVLGKGDLAIRVCEWFLTSDEYDLQLVCPVIPEPDWLRSLVRWADDHLVPVADGDFKIIDNSYDLVFSVFYDRIITADWIERHGRVLNLHNGPLPRYRGVNPINWALKNGERSHGVTIHEIVAEIDSGPVVGRIDYPIWPELEEVEDVYRRALKYGWSLFCDVMPLLDQIVAVPQAGFPTYYSREDVGDLEERAGWRRP